MRALKLLLILCLAVVAMARIEHYPDAGGYIMASPVDHQGQLRYRHMRLFELDTKPSQYPTGDDIKLDKHEDAEFLRPLKNLCVGDTTSPSQKLQNFKKGKCQPVVLVPALMSTKLVIRINCTELKQYHPDVFQNCGWTRCGSRLFKMVGKVPEEEYTLWVGVNLMFTPMMKHGLDRKCFGDLISLFHNRTSKQFEPLRGTDVQWFGNTTSTREYSDCGINAITNLAGFSRFVKGKCDVKGMTRLINSLKTMGYQSGVTMQAVPYDWRQSLQDSDTAARIVNAVRHVHNVTGKKVVVVAHSMGGIHLIHALSYFMDKAEKDAKIREILTIGTSFGGSASAIRMIVSGQSNLFDLKLLNLFTLGIAGRGINFYAQTKIASTAGFVMDTLLRPATNTSYWDDVDQRILHEHNSSNHNPYSWYPAVWQCGLCRMGPVNYRTKTPIIIIGKQYKFFATQTDYEQLFSMLAQASQSDSMLKLYKRRMSYPRNLDSMPHPQVNISVLFSNMFQTESTFIIPSRQELLLKHSKRREFVQRIVTFNGLGDSTVQANSALFFVPEWSKNKEYTTRLILYSGKNHTDPELADDYPNFKVIPTECNTTAAKVENCQHACLINDRYIVEATLDILTNKGAGYAYTPLQQSPSLSDDDISKMQRECPGINPLL